MSDNSPSQSIDALVRAVRFPTTVRALASLGMPMAAFMPLGFSLAVGSGRVLFTGRRKRAVFFELPASSVRNVAVDESRSRPPYPQIALAIVLTVETGGADVNLPIVPTSDDGRKSLTWSDAQVRRLAQRVQTAIQRESC
ncbi:hypothetical protein [Leifsonia sp. 2MCAF36]|uniref:hypothetical protein n=1 Tax=Leifsonia sp. 2MCAF36 TaxID=3232988 RepID=UPI003F9830A6